MALALTLTLTLTAAMGCACVIRSAQSRNRDQVWPVIPGCMNALWPLMNADKIVSNELTGVSRESLADDCQRPGWNKNR
jgi:hypothetical protein